MQTTVLVRELWVMNVFPQIKRKEFSPPEFRVITWMDDFRQNMCSWSTKAGRYRFERTPSQFQCRWTCPPVSLVVVRDIQSIYFKVGLTNLDEIFTTLPPVDSHSPGCEHGQEGGPDTQSVQSVLPNCRFSRLAWIWFSLLWFSNERTVLLAVQDSSYGNLVTHCVKDKDKRHQSCLRVVSMWSSWEGRGQRSRWSKSSLCRCCLPRRFPENCSSYDFHLVIVVVVKCTQSILVPQNYSNKFGPVLSFSFSFVAIWRFVQSLGLKFALGHLAVKQWGRV